MNKYTIYLVLVAALSIVMGCNDPINIGTNIEDPVDVQFTDTLTLTTKVVTGDTTASYTIGIDNRTYNLGRLQDPVFGETTSDVYMNIGLSSIPDFTGARLDSMVLAIEYDTTGFYGNKLASYNIEVYELEEKIEGDTILANRTFAVKPGLIGSRYFNQIDPRDSIQIESHIDSSKIIKLKPQLRIPIDQEYAKNFFDQDSVTFSTVENFEAFFKGLYIKAVTEDNGMIGLNLSNSANVAGITNGTNSLSVYFNAKNNLNEDVKYLYKFAISPVTYSQFQHDYSGSIVEPYIDNAGFNNNDYAFYQGLSGIETEFSFPSIRNFENTIINNAELIYYSTQLTPVDASLNYDPISVATVTYETEEGERLLTSDASIGLSPGPYSSILGGVPLELDGTEIYKHSINLTNHFSNIINNPELSTTVKVTALLRSETSARTIIFGSGATSQYKPVLRLTYTNT